MATKKTKAKTPKKKTATRKKAAPKKSSVKKATKKRAPKKSKKTTTKKAVKKTPEKKEKSKSYSIDDMKLALRSVVRPCRHCSHFPVGATELVSLLLVLVFALSAVLMTSVYALHQQSVEIDTLQQQINQ